MDLLDSILRSAKAEQYIDSFKENGIDTYTLSLLTEKDLKLLKIEDHDIRQNILNRIKSLQIQKERRNDLVVDEAYVLTILHHISNQLMFHYASLSYALIRDDIILCDVKLYPATRCLVDCINRLERKVHELEGLVNPKPERKWNKKHCIMASVTFVSAGFIVYKFIKT